MSKRKRPARPLYLVVRKLVDPATGVEVGALVPAYDIDGAMMRKRGLKVGTTVRAELTAPRNVTIHRLVHGLGGLVCQHIEGFEDHDHHSALKKLQQDAEVCCDVYYTDVPGVGQFKTVVPQSIAFDAMDESEFQRFWRGICRHICERYWPSESQETIEEMIRLMPREVA
ncbi:hypothetical protein [Halomonas sp. WWR20]